MWVRSAFWTGAPKAGSEQAFRDAINGELMPALKLLPGVDDARALWPRRLEGSPPNVHCQILVDYASLEEVDRMLASPGRAQLRLRVQEIAGLFDGEISHIDYEVAGDRSA
ncbi:MAG TPA: hypothetical protein VIT38_09665 [Allosphingosinicella sp.]|jgi:hypothetical protein